MELQSLATASDSPFGPHEELAIVSLVLDFPEMYVPLAKYFTADLFEQTSAKYVMASIKQDYDAHGVIPSRNLLRDRLAKTLTADDPVDEIIGTIQRKSDPREIPFLKSALHQWAEHRTYSLLYSDDAIAAHHRGDHKYLKKIFDDAARIQHTGDKGFWFFDQIDELFVDNVVEHITTGFPGLDACLNEGGPSTKEVLLWLAPTGVGKTLMMVNNAFSVLKQGHNVMFVTFELSALKTAIRLAGSISNEPINSFIASNINDLGNEDIQALRENQAKVKSAISARHHGADLVIYELPPEECSVDNIYSIIDSNYKQRGWRPKVVILDYLELMVSRRSSYNDDDYTRQKSVANEVRGLAKNEDVFVISATQTNRQGLDQRMVQNGDQRALPHINLDKSAESFGKTMPVDYVVSLNQSEEEYNSQPATIRMWIAKNRNGPKYKEVITRVFYDRMVIREFANNLRG